MTHKATSFKAIITECGLLIQKRRKIPLRVSQKWSDLHSNDACNNCRRTMPHRLRRK